MFGVGPLFKSMLTYWQYQSEHISVNFLATRSNFHTRKTIWKCILLNWQSLHIISLWFSCLIFPTPSVVDAQLMSWLTRFTPISLLFMHTCLIFSNYHSCIISPCGCDYYWDVYVHGHTISTTNKSTASLKNLSKNTRENMTANNNFHQWQSITWNGCPKNCCLFKIVI